jgi:hypothetical protein
MKFMFSRALLLAPVLALATPALASPPATLNDSEQPGSVIVFPKFINMPRLTVDGIANVARTEIELGAVCPTGFICPEGTKVKLRLHWVCPGAENVNSNICTEQDFVITTLTVNGKVVFAPDGIPINSNSPNTVRPAPCPRGYLIAWVIRPTDDLPIKFDALIGNAVIRAPALSTGNSTGVSAYNAIPIQANTIDGVNAPLAQPLVFNGLAGGYQQLTSMQTGDVRFDNPSPGSGLVPNVLSETFLIFLTLDVRSGLPNNPIFLPLVFYNENEVPTSISGYEFVCWDQQQLSNLPGGGSLTQTVQTTRKGVFIAGPANKVDIEVGDPSSGPSTLMAVVETIEGTAAESYQERKYDFGAVTPCLNGCLVEGTLVTTAIVPSTTFIP